MKKKKYYSLQWSLSLLVVFCWIIPVALLYWLSTSWVTTNLNQKIEQSMKIEIANGTEVTVGKLQDCVNQSIRASQDENIDNAYRLYQESGNTNQSWAMTQQYLKNTYETDDNFLAAFLFWYDHPDISFYCGEKTQDRENYFVETIRPKALQLSEEIGTAPWFFVQDNRVFLLRNLRHQLNEPPFAMLALEINLSSVFKTLLPNQAWDREILYSINGALGGIDAETVAPDTELDLLKLQQSYTVRQEGKICFYAKYRSEHIVLACRVTALEDDIFGEYNTVNRLMTGIMVILLPLLLFVIYYLYRAITRPVDRLVKGLNQVETGKFGVELNAGAVGSREFHYVFNSFNNMSHQMKHLFDRVYLEQLASRDAKIMALQGQINPRFLHNTLQLMNWEAKMAGDNKVSMMLEALSTLVEANAVRDEQALIPLREELGYVQSYLFITRQRFDDRLHVDIDVDQSLMEVMVPRLILQPLLENAVEHGIGRVAQGTIWLKMYRREDHMVMDVINDGEGMTEEDKQKIRQLLDPSDNSFDRLGTTRIGIRNVRERLNLLFGDNGTLTVQEGEEKKTTARITVPFALSADGPTPIDSSETTV